MSVTILPKAYEPKNIESFWRKFWEENTSFMPDPDSTGEPFCIIIPPPNVTGALHMGHAVNITLQDILCRNARQKGKNVLWIPGTDHAGIATQNVVERSLATNNISRHDLGREAFIQKVWEWKEQYGSKILEQIKCLGASVDWSRERFTMDEGLSKAVRKAFVTLYKQGYIYKDTYIINWCIRCHTALSDDEVNYQPHKGTLYHIKYTFEESSDYIVIATTRPETLVADTALCVHPEDERYTAFIGKKVIVPIVNRSIPIIADPYVEKTFGTGILKVTPCHDVNDWMLGKKHNLPFIQAIDEYGLMNNEAGPYAGLTKEECRIQIINDLQQQQLLITTEDIDNSLGHCYRCNTAIEPHASKQWFVAATKLAPRAHAAVPNSTKIFPEHWIKTYSQWLESIRDWCISRQIWWGHRIPAWTCTQCETVIVEESPPTECICGCKELTQEDDVLDTWFSSSIWPFSTLGWPESTNDLKKFYPTSVLVTGFDILFFWVARMMMLGLHFMDNVPFRHVYIHALVRDSEGKKMSKSSGNIIDPLAMIDRYGTDALRFTITSFAAMGRDIYLSEERIESYRHFINKLWNASRFALMNLPEYDVESFDLCNTTEIHHKWFLHRLEEVKDAVDNAIQTYHFNDAAQTLYKFLWNEFCDWYLELIKPNMKEEGLAKKQAQYVLFTGLKELLLLLHPIIPFVTSEIWRSLPGQTNMDISSMPFPEKRPDCLAPNEASTMVFIQEVITSIRTIRAELGISPAHKLSVVLHPKDDIQTRALTNNTITITNLARLESLDIGHHHKKPKIASNTIVQHCDVMVSLSGAIDFEVELSRLAKEQEKLEKELTKLTQQLENPNFINRAPKDLIEKAQLRIKDLLAAQKKLLDNKLKFQQHLSDSL